MSPTPGSTSNLNDLGETSGESDLEIDSCPTSQMSLKLPLMSSRPPRALSSTSEPFFQRIQGCNLNIPARSPDELKHGNVQWYGSSREHEHYHEQGPQGRGQGDLPQPSSELSSLSLQRAKAIHGSMENIHKPKNYRRGGRLSAGDFDFVPLPLTSSSGSTNLGSQPMTMTPEDNSLLLKYVQDEKVRGLVREATTSFTYVALRSQTSKFQDLEVRKVRKTEESAARLILHNLLLNSWRNAKGEIKRLTSQNEQLNVSIESLQLQLRVLRHMQTTEKEDALEKSEEIKVLKAQIPQFQEAATAFKTKLRTTEKHLICSRKLSQKLLNENSELKNELRESLDKKELLLKSMELEKERADKFESQVNELQNDVRDLGSEFITKSTESQRWQERTKELEGRVWDLKASLGSRDQSLEVLRAGYETLSAEKEELEQSKNVLQKAHDEILTQLSSSLAVNDDLTKALVGTSTDLEERNGRVESLVTSMKNLRLQNQRIQKELFHYKLCNVRKRRFWMNALLNMQHPLGLLRHLLSERSMILNGYDKMESVQGQSGGMEDLCPEYLEDFNVHVHELDEGLAGFDDDLNV